MIVENKKKNYSINFENCQITSYAYYEENPHIKIFIEEVDYLNHCHKCVDCNAFFKDFGTYTNEWSFIYLNKEYFLDMRFLGKEYDKNNIKTVLSNDINGTFLKFQIDTDTLDDLNNKMNLSVNEEEYEKAAIYRDKINDRK